ncbi:Rix1 complex component [Rhizopus microsporus]|uniref:Pre-rRNA-processing protein n=1 Tax=Rhizopus microsporus TaxID=58291 RepID=A0A1X0RLX9_RHIZD|nr:hypothetical protein BCV71DRAFT_294491 [Rhizopus microsporus]
MPNARKKKQAKNEDFQKKKLKVGKKKAVPDNFTDTSFRSKSIVLPNQSINEDKSHEITTSRNLTLSDLLVRLRHPSANVKKEALLGLGDICSKNPELLISSLGQVVNGLLKLFIDEDRDVRKATLNYLQETFVEIDKVELQPFMPILIMYTCSAMTHIFEDVRLDAVKFMNLWIQIAPDVVVSKFWNRIRGNYMSLLSVDASKSSQTSAPSMMIGNNTSTASIKAAVTKSHLHIHKNKLGFFSSLSKFLEAGLSEDNQDKFWFFLNYLDSKHSKESFKRKMEKYNNSVKGEAVIWNTKTKNEHMPAHPMIIATAPNLSEEYKLATFSHLHLFESSGPKNNNNKTINMLGSKGQSDDIDVNNTEFSRDDRLNSVEGMIEAFQPVLVASWLEAAPSVFVSSSTISMTPALELVYEVMKISVVLWRAVVSSQKISTMSGEWLNKHLQTTLKRFHVYFPFGADSLGNRGSKADEILLHMNILFCELTSLYLLAKTMQRSKMQLESKRQKTQDDQVPEWTETVVSFVFESLGYQVNDTMTSGSSSFRADNLVSLLPAIWGFLNCLSNEESMSLFDAVMSFQKKCQAPTTKKIASDFIIHIYTVQSTPHYNGRFIIPRGSSLADAVEERIQSITIK